MNRQNSGSHLENNSIACHDMEKTSKSFVKKFEALKVYKKEKKMRVEPACELETSSNIESLPIRLEVDSTPQVLQPLARWYNGQGRTLVCEFLEKEVKEYHIFFKWVTHIQNTMVSLNYSDVNKKKINRVINENQTFLTSILIGLDELIAHYENDDEIVGRLKDVKKGFESMVKK